MCETELDSAIPPIAATELPETPIAEHEPAVVGNQLGSLAEAVYK